jgi:hypothetical protein
MRAVRGSMAIAFQLEAAVRCVGFCGSDLWAMDATGKLHIESAESVRSFDLKTSTYGGLLAPDRSSIAMSDLDTRTFRVRALPTGEELYTTTKGFRCEAVEIADDGSIYVSGDDSVIRIDRATGRVTKVMDTGVKHIRRLSSGAILFVGDVLRVLLPGTTKPVAIGKAMEDFEVSPDEKSVVLTSELVIDVWELASRTRTRRVRSSERS